MKINENFRIESDTHTWVLLFTEQRTRKDKKGNTVDYTHEDKWYYPNISGCLKKFTDESCKGLDSIEALQSKLKEIGNTIEHFKNTYSNK